MQVVAPGILTLTQDLGRFGYQHLGMTTGGAADEHAFLWANRLLGNKPNSSALEICFGGLQLQANVATRIAITGANLQATVNGKAIAPWQTYNLSPGDRLHFGYPLTGVRAYLAVAGGFLVEPTFGSVATVMRESLGGLDGRGSPLQNGDFLPCMPAAVAPPVSVPSKFIPDYSRPLTVRVIEGLPCPAFTGRDLAQLYSTEYQITQQSDRMGVRLAGQPLIPAVSGIISEGVSFGTIQVPANGQPVILLKDRQTIGGYPKIGIAFSLDAYSLAQRQPHTPVRFTPIPLREAQRTLIRFKQFFGL